MNIINFFSSQKLKCKKCGNEFPEKQAASSHYICPSCGTYFRLGSRNRINMVVDKGSFSEHSKELASTNIMSFPDYSEKLNSAKKTSGEKEAVVTGTAKINKMDCCIFVMDSTFMMGSMGTVVGEKLTRLFEYATKHCLPVIGFTASGGARMQEGILSLMQMAKVSGAVKRHGDQGLLYVTILTDPTTGGVTASFAMEGDIILAEPNALVGFAGARVIEQTTGQKLPEGFQRAEFLMEHGFVDAIVKRENIRETLSNILQMHNKNAV